MNKVFLLKFIGFWSKEADRKSCKNSSSGTYVSQQGECQWQCLARESCVGIVYPQRNNRCHLCFDDKLVKLKVWYQFAFYRRPGNILYHLKYLTILFEETEQHNGKLLIHKNIIVIIECTTDGNCPSSKPDCRNGICIGNKEYRKCRG